MNDPWMSRLSDYIDGDLSPAEARELDQHLLTCDVCRATLAELRDVVASACALEDEFPANDLWAGIAARIGAPSLPTTFEPVATPHINRSPRRGFTFSAPQLAAAAMLLVSVSAGSVWMITKGSNGQRVDAIASGTIIQSSGSGSAQLASAPAKADPAVSETVAQLERTLADNRGDLDPATVEIVERSIVTIDAAIADATKALQADPGNAFLSRQLDNSMRKKLDILQRATERRRAGT